MLGPFGGPELIIVLVIVLLLFGAKKIPELAKGLGTGMKEFKKGASGEDDEIEGKKKNEQLDKAEEEKAGSRVVDTSAETTDNASPEARRAEQKRS